jgi:hypothetical protein
MSLPRSHRPHRPGRPTTASDNALLNATEPPNSVLKARNTRTRLPRRGLVTDVRSIHEMVGLKTLRPP